MSPRFAQILLVVLVSALVACRQPDGEPPPQTGDVPQRLVDLGRDLEGVAAGDAQAATDLADDLLVFIEEPDGMASARAMAAAICPMLAMRSLNADTLTRLSTLLWMTVAGRDFSERQVDKLKDDMRELFVSVGVSQSDANFAAGWVGTVQKAVTLRDRRWYERY